MKSNTLKMWHRAMVFADRLRPYCDRVEVAGDLRLGIQRVESPIRLDYVVIPRVEPVVTQADPEAADLSQALGNLARYSMESLHQHGRPWQYGRHYHLRLVWGEIWIWCCESRNFGAWWMYRTGSKAHHALMSEQARRRGGHFDPENGVVLGLSSHAATEEGIYALLDQPFLLPEQRQHARLDLRILDPVARHEFQEAV
jgi:DNA polymerase/3'-5' exonuclease PolX